MAGKVDPTAVLMSIKPKYAAAIFAGSKKVEFRKVRIGSTVREVVVYATAPISRIVGLFSVGRIVQDRPTTLWKRFGRVGCISAADYEEYYGDREKAVAIGVRKPRTLRNALHLDELRRGLTAPQSFAYCSSAILSKVLKAL
jgi:predicted transcriptional regulator